MHRRQLLTTLPAFGAGLAVMGKRALAAGDATRLRELYNRDLSFSDFALGQEGKLTEIWGFMAPPLKAESEFFVLTNRPMAVCPFCEPGMPWPSDILAVYARRVVNVIAFNVPITVTGTLELGDYVDPELGFYSKVRLIDATYARV